MAETKILLSGIAFGESPRWHDGRLWFADWGAQEIVAVDLEGNAVVVVRVDFSSFPMCIDFLPDGRLLIVSAHEGLLLRREHDGSLVTHADLSSLSEHPWNDIVVDGHGNVYVNNVGFDFPGGEFAQGLLALVTPDGPRELPRRRIHEDLIARGRGQGVVLRLGTLIAGRDSAIADPHQRSVTETPDGITLPRTRASVTRRRRLKPARCRKGAARVSRER